MKGSLLVLGLILTATTQTGMTDEYPPSHMCFMPERPLFLASRRHQERYREDVKRYQICMKEFIQDQKESIRMHEAALKQAQAELKGIK